MKDFILKWRVEDGKESTLKIVGPFANEDEAVEWGRNNQEQEGGDPNWNTFQLDDDYERAPIFDEQDRPILPVSIVAPY